MAEIIGVRFKNGGKVYYFDPVGIQAEIGNQVIVETARGVECGEVAIANKTVAEEEVVAPLKPIIRLANQKDLETLEENKQKEKEAFQLCQERIEKHKLDMKLVDVEYTFDNNKILFYFTADGRVDFRDLVKDLAGVFRTRIELRQIGVRDESKMLGGLGICGRPFCCSSFLGDFQPVSIKMAKEQNLSLNPTKISGTCGRLMCCLKYEQNAYDALIKITPKNGAYVETPEGRGVVCDVNLLTGKLKVRMDDKPDAAPQTFHRDEVKALKGERPPKPEAKAPKQPKEPASGEQKELKDIKEKESGGRRGRRNRGGQKDSQKESPKEPKGEE